MSTKSSPKSPTVLASPLKFLKSFSHARKPLRSLRLAVVGGKSVGKSAFTVRYLTRRFIGEYSSEPMPPYPHSATLDNKVVPLLVWDTQSLGKDKGSFDEEDTHELLDSVAYWADVVFLLYSVTEYDSYERVNAARRYMQLMGTNLNMDVPEMILVGNKSDIWQERQVVTDKACQEAKDEGYSNFFEITTRESLDQVRVVFTEGIRRGLAARVYRRRQNAILRSFSTDRVSQDDGKLGPETSPESDEGGASPKSSTSHILGSIKRRLTSPKNSMTRTGSSSTDEVFGSLPIPRSRSNTYGGIHPVGGMTRTRKLSVFEPRTANT